MMDPESDADTGDPAARDVRAGAQGGPSATAAASTPTATGLAPPNSSALPPSTALPVQPGAPSRTPSSSSPASSPALLEAHARSRSFVAGSAHASPMHSATHQAQSVMYGPGAGAGAGAGGGAGGGAGAGAGAGGRGEADEQTLVAGQQSRGQGYQAYAGGSANAHASAGPTHHRADSRASAPASPAPPGRTTAGSTPAPASPRFAAYTGSTPTSPRTTGVGVGASGLALALFHAEDATGGVRVERASPPPPPADFNSRPAFSEADAGEAVRRATPVACSPYAGGSAGAQRPRSRPRSAEGLLLGGGGGAAGSPRASGEAARIVGRSEGGSPTSPSSSPSGSPAATPTPPPVAAFGAAIRRTRSRSASATGLRPSVGVEADAASATAPPSGDSLERERLAAGSPLGRGAAYPSDGVLAEGPTPTGRPDLFRRTSGRDRRRRSDSLPDRGALSERNLQGEGEGAATVRAGTPTSLSTTISDLRLGSRPSTAPGESADGSERGMGIHVDLGARHQAATPGKTDGDEHPPRTRSAPSFRAGSTSSPSLAQHRGSGSSRADSRRSSQREETGSPSVHLEQAREEFLSLVARRASGASADSGAAAESPSESSPADNGSAVVSPSAEVLAGDLPCDRPSDSDASREVFQASFNRVFTAGGAAPVTPPQLPVDPSAAGIVSPSTLLNPGSARASVPDFAIEEGSSPDSAIFAGHSGPMASSALSSGDEAVAQSPAGLTRSGSMSRATASGSMLGRWAAARDRRASPPMLATMISSSSARTLGLEAEDSRSSAPSGDTSPASRSGDTTRLWDSVWPTAATSSPRRSPLTRSNSHTAARLHHGDPPPLQHHPHTFPPEAHDSLIAASTLDGSALSTDSPPVGPLRDANCQARRGSSAGLLAARSPPLSATRDSSTPNSPARSSFSSPEGGAARSHSRATQHHSRPQSPPGAPVGPEAARAHHAVAAARRSTGGIHTRARSPVSERKESPPSTADTAEESAVGEQRSPASDAMPTNPGTRPGESNSPKAVKSGAGSLPAEETVPSMAAGAAAEAPSPPDPRPASEVAAPPLEYKFPQDASQSFPADDLQLDLEPPSAAAASEPADLSPSSVSVEGPSPSIEMPHEDSDDRGEVHGTGERLEIAEFDEVMAAPREVLPTDVAFEDEGLNTLERIFLLSKSEYAFHRAYIARTLGDFLDDVDPCETVEYVLPLLSGFAMDEDETVKEAFAGEIHRIVWFFFSSCAIMTDEDGLIADTPPRAQSPAMSEPAVVTTITSEGIRTMPRPAVSSYPSASSSNFASTGSTESVPMSVVSRSSAANETPTRKTSVATSGSTSTGTASTATTGSASMVDTPDSTVSSQSNDPPSPKVGLMEQLDKNEEDCGELKERPAIAVHVFTPLLGSMLLSQNSAVADPTRAAMVALIAKLRGSNQAIIESWHDTRRAGDARTYVSQTGLHVHDVYPFSDRAKKAVEKELLDGLVLGMGKLEPAPGEPGLHRTTSADGGFQFDGMTEEEAAAFGNQLNEEATFGRAISLNLIASVSEFYAAEDVEHLGFLEAIARSTEDDTGVKTEAALALAYLAKVAPLQQVEAMLPLFEKFSRDEDVQVQQSSCLSLPAICKRIAPPERRRQVAVDAYRILMSSTVAVQYTALEVLGEVIYIFNNDPLGPPPELLRYYLSTKELRDASADPAQDEAAGTSTDEGLQDDEPALFPVVFEDLDRAVVAAFNFPAICLTLGPNRWHEIRETYMALQRIDHPRIRHCLASYLHELALILGPAITSADLLPFFYQYLEDSPEVREKAMANLPVLVANLHGNTPGREVKEAVELVEVLSKLWSDGFFTNWHERENLAAQTSRLLEVFVSTATEDLDSRWGVRHVDEASVEDAANGSLELLRSGLVDTFAAVRDAAVLNVPHCFEVVKGVDHLRNRLFLLLQELSGHESFKMRKTYIACVQALLDSPWSTASSPSLVNDRNADRRAFFEEYFLEPLSIMCDDLVDVKITLSKLLGQICAKTGLYAKTMFRPLRLVRMLDVLRNDESQYVTNPLEDVSNTPPGFDRQSSLRSSAWTSDDASLLDEVYTIVRSENGKGVHRMRKARSEAAGMGMARTDSDTTIRPISSPGDGGVLSPGASASSARAEDRQSRSAPAYMASSTAGSRTSSSKLSITTGRPEGSGAGQFKPVAEPNQVGMTDIFEQSFQEALADQGEA